jgi:Tol biopolymer transport system component
MYLHLMNADGSGQPISGGCKVRWSPDGSQLLFTGYSGANEALYIVNSDGTGLRPLYERAASVTPGGWSPDGSMVVFHQGAWGSPDTRDIYAMKADGSGDAIQLTDYPGADTLPDWWGLPIRVFCPVVGGPAETDSIWRP